jgi:hypothetical protein
MLGDLIEQGQGKRTGRRVLCTEPTFKVEVSFEETTKIMGVDGMDIGTYVSYQKPDGSLHGTGEGVIATMEGEIVTWTGIGVGKLAAGGAVSYRGCLSFSTKSAKLARLNSTAAVFEFDVDASGNTASKMWEWK